jgi:hypothetical protein
VDVARLPAAAWAMHVPMRRGASLPWTFLPCCCPSAAVEALDKWSAQAAGERGLVNVLLGNACFTTAISALNRECSQLSNEQRCWLGIQFTMCFQRASGFKVCVWDNC